MVLLISVSPTQPSGDLLLITDMGGRSAEKV